MKAKELALLLNSLEGNPEILIEHEDIVTNEKVLEPVCVGRIVVRTYKQGLSQKYKTVTNSVRFSENMIETIKLL